MSPETSSYAGDSGADDHILSAAESLSLILGLSDDPSASLLHDPVAGAAVSGYLRRPGAGSGDDELCRWLYDTFQSTDPALQLAVLRSLPALAAAYLPSRSPLPGFEAVLLALYAHETLARSGDPLTVSVPDSPSIYNDDARAPGKNIPGEDRQSILTILSPSLEPHGTIRATRRARIVGVALELYYSKISHMPVSSKLEFCEHCVTWSGQKEILKKDTETPDESNERSQGKGGKISLPWELFQPMLRILGHCLNDSSECEELRVAALVAIRCLHARATYEINPRAVLATRSLLRLASMAPDRVWEQVGVGTMGDSLELESGRIVI